MRKALSESDRGHSGDRSDLLTLLRFNDVVICIPVIYFLNRLLLDSIFVFYFLIGLLVIFCLCIGSTSNSILVKFCAFLMALSIISEILDGFRIPYAVYGQMVGIFSDVFLIGFLIVTLIVPRERLRIKITAILIIGCLVSRVILSGINFNISIILNAILFVALIFALFGVLRGHKKYKDLKHLLSAVFVLTAFSLIRHYY